MLNVRKTSSSTRVAKAPKAPKVTTEPDAATRAPEVTTEHEINETSVTPVTIENTTGTNVDSGTSQIKVDRGIPLPDSVRAGGRNRYPWESLEIGDSFFTPGKIETFYNLASTASKKLGRKFIARKWMEDGRAGVRVWRIQ